MSAEPIEHRRYVRAARAAAQLGIGVDLLNGLIDGKQVEGFRQAGQSGKYMWFIYADELARVKQLIGTP